AYFVGLSEGGRIALDYATRRPERVDGLCVIGSGLSGYEPTDEREEAMWMDLARRDQEIGHLAGAGDTRRAIDALLDLWAPAIDRPTRQWARGIALENHAAALGRFDELQQPIDPPAIRRLEAIGAPVLALTGTKDFPAYERVADLLVSRLPNAQKEALEGADHLANLSRREAFDAQLEGFLARLDFLAMRRGSTR
ncbi:MAG TPA: alpha/beta hydrolase, partial [Thermoplasmata archaeon]|nr:alpha/beta hydrolase [Thermoplasmata archaeon]